MDNLTHTLAGAALGEAGLKRLSSLGMAALMIGANLPDIDALAIPAGEGLTFRRGWTHGPVALVVLPVVLTVGLIGWDRWQARRGNRPVGRPPVRPAHLLLLSSLGVLSHPFLDWLNTYGIRLLMPFSDRWFYGDSIFIIDPWIWLALGTGVLLSRRRGDSHEVPVPRPARLALAAVTAYIGLMLMGTRDAHDAAMRHMRAAEQREPLRVMAGPVPLNPLRRQLIYDMGEHYRFGVVDWVPSRTVTLEPGVLPTNLGHPAVRRSASHQDVQGFLYWSRFPFFTVEERADLLRVRAGDARFSRRPGGWAGVEVEVEGRKTNDE
jgi:inner membrane protein